MQPPWTPVIEEPSARMVMGCRRCILCSRGRKRAASPLSPLLGEVSNRSGAAGRQASRSRSCSGGGGLYSCGIAAGRVDSHRRSCSRASVHRFVLAVVPRRTSAQLGTPTAILYGRSARVPRSSATRALGARTHDSHRVQLWALLLFIIADRDGLRKPKPVNAARNAARKFSTRCTLCF